MLCEARLYTLYLYGWFIEALLLHFLNNALRSDLMPDNPTRILPPYG